MTQKLTDLTEITLKMLLDEGIIKPGQEIYSDTKPVQKATITQNGFIELSINGLKKEFSYPSGAARAVVNLSVNGWKFWKVKINSDLVEISELRRLFKDKR